MKELGFPLVIAHRGGGDNAPENTLEGFKKGRELGFLAGECDAKLTCDGACVLLHDDGLERTGGIAKMAADMTKEEIVACDVSLGHPDFKGVTVPLMRDVIDFCKESGMGINVEVKPSPGTDEETALVVAEAAIARVGDSGIPLLFSSFSLKAMETLRDNYPEAKRALLLERWPSDKMVMDHLDSLDCMALNLDDNLTTKERVKLVIDSGRSLLIWTVNDPQRAKELVDWGVTGIITDSKEVLAALS